MEEEEVVVLVLIEVCYSNGFFPVDFVHVD